MSDQVAASAPSASPAETSASSGTSSALPQVTPQQAERYEIKVAGQTKSLTLAELKQMASKSEGAEQKFQKASELEKQNKALHDAFKSKDVRKLAATLGVDVKEARELMMDSLVPLELEDAMSPEEKTQYERDKKLKEYEDRDLTEKEKRDKERQDKELVKHREQFDNDMYAALESVGMLRDPYFGTQVAQVMLNALSDDVDISASEAVEIVKDRFESDTKNLFGKMSLDDIKKYLPADLLKKLRESDVKAIKDVQSKFTSTQVGETKKDSSSGKKEQIKMSQYFRNIRENRK